MISLYLATPTWLHRIRVSYKLLALALISLVLIPLNSLWLWGAGLVLTFVLYGTLGGEALKQLISFRPILWSLLILLVLQWWLAGWHAGVLLVLRMSTLILLANAITLTSSMDDITEVMLWLLQPLKKLGLATELIAFAMSLCIRFIPLLIAILDHLIDAWKARGGGKQYWLVIAPMIIQSLVFSQHVADAINARGGIPKQ
ncbi:energy-coupling factor transporter transmembrane component T family protein [Salinibius halmophilus]|uniref:energy-coupling factor transporter transmembrane component T family protein n=1 Tax=Salinibius halmophilus TaxID=1853216 RepID=UPI000E66C7EC|nr:energy-coupling factor transporter transmembrane component T [Salinibius halmophilus]